MRRTSTFVAVLALALLAAPAALADAAPTAPAVVPAPDAAQPTGPALCPTTDPLGNPAAAPTYVTAGPCSVQRQCDDGSTISCSGSSTCSSGPGSNGGYVTCDGVTTWCPTPPPEECPYEGIFCKYHGSICGECYGASCRCFNSRCICP